MSSDLASYIDHTVLAPTATKADIIKVCDEAYAHSFASVCIPPCFVKSAKTHSNDKILIGTVIGFPLGYNASEAKLYEAVKAVDDGADELDMVINQCMMKDGEQSYVGREIEMIKKRLPDTTLKVIIETCNLNLEEKKTLLRIVTDSGADYIKTSTGFGSAGAKLDDIKLFHQLAIGSIKIKAAGGIRDRATAQAFVDAGANRLGSSSGIKIVKG